MLTRLSGANQRKLASKPRNVSQGAFSSSRSRVSSRVGFPSGGAMVSVPRQRVLVPARYSASVW